MSLYSIEIQSYCCKAAHTTDIILHTKLNVNIHGVNILLNESCIPNTDLCFTLQEKFSYGKEFLSKSIHIECYAQ
jgi:hypothetical protein